jgi:hypothetical protein
LPGKKHKAAVARFQAFAAEMTADHGSADKVHTAQQSRNESASNHVAANGVRQQLEEEMRTIARLEYRVSHLCSLLNAELDATVHRTEQLETRSIDEIRADVELEKGEFELFEEQMREQERQQRALSASYAKLRGESEEAIYNPKNVPLGWDGKPIPYWLYKLHGLNQEFTCEICSGYRYFGPRNFEKHFGEWRHAYGMRVLGIPNTKQFVNVSKVDDAQKLWKKLQEQSAQRTFRADDDEELEDSQGNVFQRKQLLQSNPTAPPYPAPYPTSGAMMPLPMSMPLSGPASGAQMHF